MGARFGVIPKLFKVHVLFLSLIFFCFGCKQKQNSEGFTPFINNYLGQSLKSVQSRYSDAEVWYLPGNGHRLKNESAETDLLLSCDSLCNKIKMVEVRSPAPCFGQLCIGHSVSDIHAFYPALPITLSMPMQQEMFVIPGPEGKFIAELLVRSDIGQVLGKYQGLVNGATSQTYDKNGSISHIRVRMVD